MAIYRIGNEYISRTLEVNNSGIRSISLRNEITDREYLKTPLNEFSFWINGERLSSYGSRVVHEVNGNVDETVGDYTFEGAEYDENHLSVSLSRDSVRVKACYNIFPGVAGIEKHLCFTNTGNSELKLEMLIFDNPCIAPGEFSDCDFYRGHQDTPAPLCFCNDGTEDIIRCHNEKLGEGWMMGTSAPGILRYILCYPHWANVLNGYSCGGAPFAKYLAPGETFVTDSSLLAVYKGDHHESTSFRDLVRAVLPKPVSSESIMYCSWLPFLKNINASLIKSLMDNASEMGFQYFVLDDGWFAPPGDHVVDKAKFPNGLEEVSRHATEKGLKFGLWLNIGTNYGQEKANEAWMAKRADDDTNHLGFARQDDNKVMCFATEHRDYVLKQLDDLCNRYNVSYFKLDFSSIFSPYGILPWGCHSKKHKYHHGWNDSFIEMYRGLRYLREELKKRHPNLLVDFSFESFGTDVPNIAALQFSEIHHISNTSANNTKYQSIDRVRRSFYRWSEKLPPERLLNGLLSIQDDRGVEYFLTSLIGAPLVAGDLINLSPDIRQRVRTLCNAFLKTVANGPLTEFKVLASNEDYDAFMRYSKDGRGIIGVFNRTDTTLTLATPAGISPINVENGAKSLTAPPNNCAMFTLA